MTKWQLPLGVYVVRPYNFNLNPFPDEKMNIQRDVTLQGRGMYLQKYIFSKANCHSYAILVPS